MSGRLRPISGIIVNGDTYKFRYRGKEYIAPYVRNNSRSDATESFISGENIVHVMVSQRFGYAGVEVYNFINKHPVGENFLQDESDIEDVLGKKGLDLSLATIGDRLSIGLVCC